MTAIRRNGPMVLTAILFLLLVALAWVGFIGSDDVIYSDGAYGWLNSFPYVGGHGSIRYTITLPIAAAYRLIGENEFALALPSLIYTLGLILIGGLFVRRADGDTASLATLILFATSPLFVIQGSIANVDLIELFFVMASFALWWRALDAERQTRWLIASGAMAGLAFLTRETAVFIIPFFALLFLTAYRLPRWRYLWIAVGFLAVWAAELLYLGIMTGDPLYRIHISMNHDSSIDRTIDLAGNVIVHPLIDPLLVLLINQEFMLIFWVAIPIGLWLCFGRDIPVKRQGVARIVALFGATWFVCAASAQSLLPLNPRYFAATTASAIMLVGIGLAELGRRRRASLALGIAFALVIANLAGIVVEDKVPMYHERALARFVAAHPTATVTTDPMTRHRAILLLTWAKAQQRVEAAPPKPGGLHFYNPNYATRANRYMPANVVPLYQPRSDWATIATISQPAPALANWVEISGLRTLFSPSLWCKLRRCRPGAVFYLVGGTSPRPSTMAMNRLSAAHYVAVAPIPPVPLFAQGAPVDGRKRHRL
jgi:4-amino-4-deoxy-L-arabinose transferase-like glycosyltransferase